MVNQKTWFRAYYTIEMIDIQSLNPCFKDVQFATIKVEILMTLEGIGIFLLSRILTHEYGRTLGFFMA